MLVGVKTNEGDASQTSDFKYSMQTTLEIPKQAAMMTEPSQLPNEQAQPPKTLDDYAKSILDLHQRVEHADRVSKQYGRVAIAAAINAGEYLNEAKELVGHGNWLQWLQQNCTGISDTTR